MKARTVAERGEEGPLCDPGSELLLGGSARGSSSTRIINGIKKKKRNKQNNHTKQTNPWSQERLQSLWTGNNTQGK